MQSSISRSQDKAHWSHKDTDHVYILLTVVPDLGLPAQIKAHFHGITVIDTM